MDITLAKPIQLSLSKIRIKRVELLRFPDRGIISLEIVDEKDNVIDTRAVDMTETLLETLFSSSFFKNVLRSAIATTFGDLVKE